DDGRSRGNRSITLQKPPQLLLPTGRPRRVGRRRSALRGGTACRGSVFGLRRQPWFCVIFLLPAFLVGVPHQRCDHCHDEEERFEQAWIHIGKGRTVASRKSQWARRRMA